MITTEQRIEALMKLHPKGYDLSLDRIERLLGKLGDPHTKLPPVLHFAGTNGKGSTLSFTRAICEAAGLSVHAHTSPHLVNWHERYRMGREGAPGELVSDELLSNTIERVAMANDGQAITVFELMTAVGFLLFSEHPADVCLLEVGLGGRFDSTNIIPRSAVSIITPVSLDHEAFLGDTIAKIAFEKAGIIKRGSRVVIGPQADEGLAVIERQARKQGVRPLAFGQHFSASEQDGRLVFQDEAELLDLPLPSLPGEHQIENAGTAICACRELADVLGIELSEAVIADGLQNTSWPGRMQRMPAGHLSAHVDTQVDIWLDGGHNPGAAAMLARQLQKLQGQKPARTVMICGMLNTKDPKGYFQALSGQVDHIICVSLLSTDAEIPPAQLSEIAAQCGHRTSVAENLEAAFVEAQAGGCQRLMVAGSLYLVGDALRLNGTPPS